MHSCPGKMRGLEHQLAILTDVVETPSDASDHGSFPVASAWPKLPQLARAGQSNRRRAGTGSASPERATRPPLWPAGMAEGNRETFRHRVGLSSHGSPAKGGPKSKCLARVKIARTSAGPPNLTISDLSRFPLPAFRSPLSAPRFPLPAFRSPLSAPRFPLPAFRSPLSAPRFPLPAFRSPLSAPRFPLPAFRSPLSAPRFPLPAFRSPLSAPRFPLPAFRSPLSAPRFPLPAFRSPLSAPRFPLPAFRSPLSAPRFPLPAFRSPLSAPRFPLPAFRSPLSAPRFPLPAFRSPLSAPREQRRPVVFVGSPSQGRLIGLVGGPDSIYYVVFHAHRRR